MNTGTWSIWVAFLALTVSAPQAQAKPNDGVCVKCEQEKKQATLASLEAEIKALQAIVDQGGSPKKLTRLQALKLARMQLDFPETVIKEMQWSYAGKIPGKKCVNIHEPGDPAGNGYPENGWADNFLCFDRDYGFQWSFAGQIPGMFCTQIWEPGADNHANWVDNFLCAPRDYGLRWSVGGKIPGMECVALSEPGDPNYPAWQDNYLCRPKP